VEESPQKALPRPLTPLIGRKQEIATLCQLLRHPDVRLLTITGPGGVGKTRLALQTAAELRSDFLDGVLFIPLDTLTDPGLVVATIAYALGLREEGKRSFIERIQQYLADKQFLLVLDNFEQIVAAAPALVEILTACPETKIMLTSRAPLHVQGEHEFVVPLFSLPDVQRLRRLSGDIVAAIGQNAAIRLFVQRVKLVSPTFELSDENALAIAQICARLDGLPLAIELAAARVKLFSPQALLLHLNEASGQPSLALLTSGARDLPVRQQTLRSAIEWSYRLLATEDQKLFRQLAIFVGGFTWQAADATLLVQPRQTLLDAIVALVDQGLVQQTQVGGEPRFSMLVTIREFAGEQLEQDTRREALEQAHAAYYLQLAQSSEAHLFGPKQGEYLIRLEREQDNLRAALQRAWVKQDGETAVRLTAHLWRFWQLHGDISEGAQWLDQAIALFRTQSEAAGDARQAQLLTIALIGAGMLAIYQNQYPKATAAFHESLAMARTLDDKPRIALALHGLARMAMRIGQFREAESLHTKSIALFAHLHNQWGIAQATLYRGLTLWAEGKFAQAHAPLEEALALCRQVDDPQGTNQAMEALAWAKLGIGEFVQAQQLLETAVASARTRQDRLLLTRGLNGLGSVLRRQGKVAAAHTALAEAFLVAFELGDRWHVAGCLVEIAYILLITGETRRPARIVGACESMFPNINRNAPASSAAAYRELVTQLPAKLGKEAYETLLAEGAAIATRNELADWEPLISENLTAEPLPTANATPLTERAQEVLRWLAQGLTNSQIAERLIVSPFTINAHLRNIYNKLDVPSRPAAIRYALEHHLV
jgi:predicted ATPase/DNA-binding CsgD family transcriptional regulator